MPTNAYIRPAISFYAANKLIGTTMKLCIAAYLLCDAGNTRCSSSGSHEVGDLSDAQSLAFLRQRGLDEASAREIVGLAGGRCIELVAAAESIHNGESIAGAFQVTHD